MLSEINPSYSAMTQILTVDSILSSVAVKRKRQNFAPRGRSNPRDGKLSPPRHACSPRTPDSILDSGADERALGFLPTKHHLTNTKVHAASITLVGWKIAATHQQQISNFAFPLTNQTLLLSVREFLEGHKFFTSEHILKVFTNKYTNIFKISFHLFLSRTFFIRINSSGSDPKLLVRITLVGWSRLSSSEQQVVDSDDGSGAADPRWRRAWHRRRRRFEGGVLRLRRCPPPPQLGKRGQYS